MDAKALGSHLPLFTEIPPADPIFPVMNKILLFSCCYYPVNGTHECTMVLLYLILFHFHTQTGLSVIKTTVQNPVMMEKVKRERSN